VTLLSLLIPTSRDETARFLRPPPIRIRLRHFFGVVPALAAVVGLALAAIPVAASPTLETFVLSAGGGSAGTFNPPCTSFYRPAPVFSFFGGWGVAIPQAGLDTCGVAGGFDEMTSPTGPLSDERSLVSSWPAIPTNTFSGSAAATANYGSVSAHAHAEFTGVFSNLNVTGSDGFGIAEEGFTITSPSVANGQSGTVVFSITVTGEFSTTSSSQVGVQLANRANGVAGGQPLLLFSCYVAGAATETPSLYSWSGDDLSGFTRTPGAMSGSDQITSAAVPIVFGTSFDYEFGLLVEAVSALTSIVDSDFEAAITGIAVKGPEGIPVTDFVIVSASGTPYGASGATAVGEAAPNGVGDAARLSAFPNPSRGDVELRFAMPRPVAPRVEIYDATGRRVRGLDDANARAGVQSVLWDGRNDHGAHVPSGVYFARVSWPDQSATTRLTLLR